jgi:hypothetical protein
MQAAQSHPISPAQTVQLHIDGGANRPIMNQIDHLINVRNIKPYYMSSASSENVIKCTALGYLPWRSPQKDTLLVKCFYSQQAVDTIISPPDIVLNDLATFHSWTQHANLQDNEGYITFTSHAGEDHHVTYPLVHRNGLWYYNYNDVTDYSTDHKPTVNRLSFAGLYDLYHARLGHPGERTLSIVHLHVDGIPKLVKPFLYKCRTCMLVNATKRAVAARQLLPNITSPKSDKKPIYFANNTSNTLRFISSSPQETSLGRERNSTSTWAL